MRRRPAGLVALTGAVPAALTLLLLVGCGDAAGGGDGDGSAPALAVTATRSSLFDSGRAFRIELTNQGREPVDIEAFRLDSPLFAPQPADDRDVRLAPGRLVLIPLVFGESVCPASGPSMLAAEVDGQPATVPLSQDPAGVMEALHEVECAEAAVREAADLRFTDAWRRTGPTSARGAIRATATTGASVVVRSVEGNIVFGVRVPEGNALIEVGPEQSEDRLDLEVVVDRCDTHALIESKRTFQFPLAVTLDGEGPDRVVLEPEGAARRVFQSLLQACIG